MPRPNCRARPNRPRGAALVTAQEAANVNLTHMFANVLWDTQIAPFLARAQSLSPGPLPRCWQQRH
jgi:hypothetical protein